MKTRSTASLRRLLVAVGLLPAAFASAQSSAVAPVTLAPRVVTATRTPSAADTLGTAVDAITAADLARRQITSLRGALTGIPGAPALASGATGGATSLFLRGTNSNQTLFLVDGIRISDANTDYLVWLGGACVSACDSLEVAHGPQSTLYGGEAVGGVISLRAQRGTGNASVVAVEAGSFGTVQGALATQGESGLWAYNVSAAGGATKNDRPNNEFTSGTVTLRLDRKLTSTVDVGGTLRVFHGRYGSPGNRFTNDPDNEDRESNNLATVFADFAHAPAWTSRVVLGGQLRRFVSDNPSASGARQVTVVRNQRAVLDWQTTFAASARHRITAGTTAEHMRTRNTGFGDINERQRLLAFFVQDEFSPLENVHLTAGLRSDDHDTFGRATTGRVTAAWLPGDARLKLRATYGTAFRAPSFLDLYGRSAFYAGNPNLRPEEARGWDTGLDYYLPGNAGTVSVTWFETRLEDLVVFDFGVFPGTVRNVERARTRGLEFSANVNVGSATKLQGAYAFLEADNLSQNNRLLRRPRHSASLDVWHDFGGGLSVGGGFGWVAQREDVHAALFSRVDGEDYAVARVYAAWTINPTLALKGRVENLLDEKYEEVHGYPQPGTAVFAGVEWRW
jgi:vitamin B12 transporter